MSPTRSYVSPKREAQAAATRQAILEAFCAQLLDEGRDDLSPTEAAAAAGCSVRTVHTHFPTRESRVESSSVRRWCVADWIQARPSCGTTSP